MRAEQVAFLLALQSGQERVGGEKIAGDVCLLESGQDMVGGEAITEDVCLLELESGQERVGEAIAGHA